MIKPALSVVMLSALVLIGASCAPQAGGDADTAEAGYDPRDFNGIWMGATADLTQYLLPGEEIILTEYGAERYRNVDQAAFPGNWCSPYGPNRSMTSTNPYMIVQSEDVIAVLNEHVDYRAFYMDGRPHPDDIMEYPEWMGHSVGHWEGDTLVVDTIGIYEESWLDRGGLMHSNELHLTERFEKIGPDTVRWTVTVEDPIYFTQPWTYQLDFERQDYRLLPARCSDNELDTEHMQPYFATFHENPPTFPPGSPENPG